MFSRIATIILLIALGLFLLGGCGRGYGPGLFHGGPGYCGPSWSSGSSGGGYGPQRHWQGW